jgi:NAD(P)-dependent dehydrogenase (short-subunit alcohol dehydrogenase family)
MAVLDDSFHKLALDVTSDESVNLAVKEAMSIAGKIDILINNAGVECCGRCSQPNSFWRVLTHKQARHWKSLSKRPCQHLRPTPLVQFA